MSAALMTLIALALLGVVAVLALGLWNMLRDGGAKRSQKLMRWRVGLQFFAIVVIMAAIYMVRG